MATGKLLVGMGEGVVARSPGAIASLGIGSCAVLTLYDPRAKVGGLAHVMLPDSRELRQPLSPYSCADTAVAALVDELRRQGAAPARLTAKLVGGAQLFDGYHEDFPGIGPRNIARLKELLAQAGITLAGWDVAGSHGRNVEFCLDSGQVRVTALERPDREF